MNRIIAATAMALMMSTPVMAQTQNGVEMGAVNQFQKGDFFAADFIGKEIYRSDSDWDENTTVTDGWQDNWENIGQVENVVLSQDGSVRAVILEVGGFLDIGDKHIAVPMDRLTFVRDQSEWDNYFLAVRANREDLEGMGEFNDDEFASMTRDDNQQMTDNQSGNMADDDNQQMADNQSGNMADDDNQQMTDNDMQNDVDANETTASTPPATFNRPMMERDGYMNAERRELTADRLKNANLYSVNDEDIGEIGEIILNENGEVDRVVLDVGGFLGMGEHHVDVSMDEIQIMRDAEWGDVRVYIDASKEELESRPEYNG